MKILGIPAINAFQFHIGAIRSTIIFHQPVLLLCFNSILVQLEEVRPEDLPSTSTVSIPYWCN